MAHVCYSLYFTDFVGEAVFGGNPRASVDTLERKLYEEGVRFGCWGMSMYSLSCSCYSLVIERLIQRFRARKVRVSLHLLMNRSANKIRVSIILSKYLTILYNYLLLKITYYLPLYLYNTILFYNVIHNILVCCKISDVSSTECYLSVCVRRFTSMACSSIVLACC